MNFTLLGKRIAIYARSSSHDEQDPSINEQVRLCRDYIGDTGGNPGEVLIFSDRATPGARKDRPQFDRLRRLVDLGEVEVVVTESVDRLMRDIGDAGWLWKLVESGSLRLISVSAGFDSIVLNPRVAAWLRANGGVS